MEKESAADSAVHEDANASEHTVDDGALGEKEDSSQKVAREQKSLADVLGLGTWARLSAGGDVMIRMRDRARV